MAEGLCRRWWCNDGLTALQQVQPVNSVEQTLKQILELLYANATDLADLSDNETDQMREIARRCPLDDGFGVYMARATLLKVDTFPRNYSNKCELAMPFDKQGNKMGSSSESDSPPLARVCNACHSKLPP